MTSAHPLDRPGTGTAGLGARAVVTGLAATVVLVVAGQLLLVAATPLPAMGAVIVGLAVTSAIAVLPATTPGGHPRLATGAVLVPALAVLPWHGVVVAVAVGTAVGWVGRRAPGLPTAPPATRSAEVGLAIGQGVLAAGLAGLATLGPAAGTPARVALAAAAGAMFLAVEHGLAADAPAVDGLGVHAIGLVAGTLVALTASLPGSTVWLLLHALVVAVVAGTCWRLAEGRATATALLRIAAHAHASIDLRAVERSIGETLAPLLHAARVEVRDLPPAAGEVGTPLPVDGGDPMWLVTAHVGRVPAASAEHDRRLLASAAPLVATAVENARRHDDMVTRATVDPLTGVANRGTFEEELRRRLRHGRVTDTATALAVLDLDGFKAVNDETGHQAGDALLVEVARRLAGAVRRGDLVARLGGDEFAVVASVAPEGGEDRLRARLTERLADLRAPDDRVVGVSLGVAVAPRDATTPAALYEAADARMYAAKPGRDG